MCLTKCWWPEEGKTGWTVPVSPDPPSIVGVGSGAKLLITLTWLGDLDSNQGCPGQSREFYR